MSDLIVKFLDLVIDGLSLVYSVRGMNWLMLEYEYKCECENKCECEYRYEYEYKYEYRYEYECEYKYEYECECECVTQMQWWWWLAVHRQGRVCGVPWLPGEESVWPIVSNTFHTLSTGHCLSTVSFPPSSCSSPFPISPGIAPNLLPCCNAF